jgi:hypothetical protein
VENITFGEVYETPPTLVGVSPTPTAVQLSANESFVWEVDAADADGDLSSLEIDNNLYPAIDEVTVYASTTNPYGSQAAEDLFDAAGVSVSYVGDQNEGKWTIDFGATTTDSLVSQGGITFYVVLEDEAGNEFGSMDPTTPENTFEYELSRPFFTFSGNKYEDTTDGNGLGDWEFELIAMGEGPFLFATTTTDTYGYYEFEIYYQDIPVWAARNPDNFIASSYVQEVPQDGWEQVDVQRDGEPLPDRPEDGIEDQVCYLPGEAGVITPTFRDDTPPVEIVDSVRCDFINTRTTEAEVDDSGSSSSGGGSSTGTRTDRNSTVSLPTPTPEPQVLGESTTNFCPFLVDYMQMGAVNDSFAVTKLQIFLNIFKDVFGGSENPLTGTFGIATDANVKAFQEHYRAEILDPWFEQGIVPHNRPTGFVYKTTLWKINSIVCSEEVSEPELAGEDLDSNVAIN